MRRLLALAGLLAGTTALAIISALPAGAAVQPHTTGSATARASNASPAYEQELSSTIRCATWSGTLSWGGNGSIAIPAYIDVSGKLTDNCNSGYAQLHIHWDTINNPKDKMIKQVGPNSSANTPFSTEDHVNTYKDIYVWICSEGAGGWRCGNHKGPGA